MKEIPAGVLIHTLASGATVVSLSAHEFRFSDGTVSLPQVPEVVNLFTLHRHFEEKGEIKGMKVVETSMVLDTKQCILLRELAEMADIVILPFPVLTALREQGCRDKFPNCLAFNSTPETQRSAPNEKVIDLNRWSY